MYVLIPSIYFYSRRGLKDEFDSVCNENLVGEKGVKARYPHPSQVQFISRGRPSDYPSVHQLYKPQLLSYVAQRQGVLPPEVAVRNVLLRPPHRIVSRPTATMTNTLHSMDMFYKSQTITNSPIPLQPMSKPTQSVGIPGNELAMQSSKEQLIRAPRLKSRSKLTGSKKFEPESQVFYGVPRVTQTYFDSLTTTAPTDPRVLQAIKQPGTGEKVLLESIPEKQNYKANYFHKRIRQFDSSEEESSGETGETGSSSLSSFASLFHNGKPMGFFSITQAAGNQYPTIDFYPVEKINNVNIPM